MTDLALTVSYRRCRELLAQHGRTYYLASRLLPPVKQPAVWALYGFARYVDDLVDVELDRVPDERIIDELEDELMTGIAAGHSAHPLLAATVHTVHRCDIDPQWLRDFLNAMRADLRPQTYRTWADLKTYTWGSAAVIGLQMARVIGIRGDVQQAESAAAALGHAFQITNFCRDYDEDRIRGRVYLPGSLFTNVDAEPGTTDPDAARAVIARASAYARELYTQAEAGIDLLEPDGQPCIRAAFVLYQGILDEIEKADYNVLGVRHRVGRTRRMRVALPLLAQSLRIRLRA